MIQIYLQLLLGVTTTNSSWNITHTMTQNHKLQTTKETVRVDR